MMRIKIRDSLAIVEEAKDVYQVLFTATRRVARFQVDALVREILSVVQEESDYETIKKSLGRTYATHSIDACINALSSEGILVLYDSEQDSAERHARQRLFLDELTTSSEETSALQQKICSARIAVFGVGGIGTWIVNGLVQIGVSFLKIVDPDVVQESNLNRQLFFTSQDIGRYKVDVVAERVSDATIETHRSIVSETTPLDDIVADCDFLVNCTDLPSVAETTRMINRYAVKYKIAYSVAGGYNLHLGMIGPIIIPGRTACFDCFLAYQREHDPLKSMKRIKDVTQTGSLGPIAGAIANIHVLEIFKHLTGKGTCNYDRFAEIDFLNFQISWREYSKREAGKTCAH